MVSNEPVGWGTSPNDEPFLCDRCGDSVREEDLWEGYSGYYCSEECLNASKDRRLDSSGRDVTGLPGLWDESDSLQAAPKYTPGPWKSQCFLVLQDGGDGLSICATGVVGTNRPGSQAEADARLIALAPEMLGAIEGALAIVDLWCPSGEAVGENVEESRALVSMLQKFREIVRRSR